MEYYTWNDVKTLKEIKIMKEKMHRKDFHIFRKDMGDTYKIEKNNPNIQWLSSHSHVLKTIGAILTLGLIIFISSCFHSKTAHAFTDEQIANAIKKAEGTWNYGIKTIKCKTEKDCREICLRTIKNNRIRYKKDARQPVEDYLSYLSRIYAPIGARNDPKGLNNNWLRNVRYFLATES